jgi:hypothetical protein
LPDRGSGTGHPQDLGGIEWRGLGGHFGDDNVLLGRDVQILAIHAEPEHHRSRAALAERKDCQNTDVAKIRVWPVCVTRTAEDGR